MVVLSTWVSKKNGDNFYYSQLLRILFISVSARASAQRILARVQKIKLHAQQFQTIHAQKIILIRRQQWYA